MSEQRKILREAHSGSFSLWITVGPLANWTWHSIPRTNSPRTSRGRFPKAHDVPRFTPRL